MPQSTTSPGQRQDQSRSRCRGQRRGLAAYTIHLSGICVEPRLQALYNQCHAGGRKQLPVLKGGQPLGRALGGEIQAAIRDTGSWMDPRVKKDWWQGK